MTYKTPTTTIDGVRLATGIDSLQCLSKPARYANFTDPGNIFPSHSLGEK